MFLPAIVAFILLAFLLGLIVLGGAKRLGGKELRISRRSFIYAMVIPLALGLVFLGLGAFLEWHHTPGFCGDMCHSMGPYHATYKEPGNNSMLITHPDEHVTCADCHTGPGWSGFFGSFLVVPWELVSETFNLYEPGELHADVPNDWCSKCHDNETASKPGDVIAPGNVSVEAHDTDDRCTDCHLVHRPGLGISTDACGMCHGINMPEWDVYQEAHGARTGGECMDCHDRPHPEDSRIQWYEVPGIDMEFCSDCHNSSYVLYTTTATERSLEQYGECMDCHVEHRTSQSPPHDVGAPLDQCIQCHPTTDQRGGIHDRSVVDYVDVPVEMEFCSGCHNSSYVLYTTTATERSLELYGECTDCHTHHGTSQAPHDVDDPYDQCMLCHPTTDQHGGIHDRSDVDYLGVPGVEDGLCDPCHAVDDDNVVADHGRVACVACHSGHGLRVEFDDCERCHENIPPSHDTDTGGCTRGGDCHSEVLGSGKRWYHE